MLKQIESAYPKEVRVVFKQYPLPMHANAKPAAIAAHAAQKQNRFWEMHDLLLANQRQLDPASLRRYAESLGLDMAAYDRAVADPESARVIEQQALEAQRAGVQGTPAFFINGVQVPIWSFGTMFATMQKLIDAATSGGDVGMAAGQIRADLIAQQIAEQQRKMSNPPPPIDFDKIYEIDTTGSPSKGPANAPITVVEWGDYQ